MCSSSPPSKGGGGGLRHHLRHLHGSGDELHYLYILSCNNEASGNSMGYQTRMLLNSWRSTKGNYSGRAKVDSFLRYMTEAVVHWIERSRGKRLETRTMFHPRRYPIKRLAGVKEVSVTKFIWKGICSWPSQLIHHNETKSTGIRHHVFLQNDESHFKSGMLLNEESLITLFIKHMQPQYQEQLRYKRFPNLKALKEALVLFDRKRRYHLQA